MLDWELVVGGRRNADCPASALHPQFQTPAVGSRAGLGRRYMTRQGPLLDTVRQRHEAGWNPSAPLEPQNPIARWTAEALSSMPLSRDLRQLANCRFLATHIIHRPIEVGEV